MAIAFVKNIGTDTRSAITSVITVPADGVAAGKLIFVQGARNSSAAAVTGIADTGGNTYTQIVADASGSNDTSIWKCLVSVALVSGNTITVTYASMGLNAAAADEFSGMTSTASGTATNANGTSTTPSTATTPTAGTCLLLAGLVVDNDTGADAFTEDTDTAGGGSWVTLTKVSSVAPDTIRRSYKITTTAVAQTYDPTLGTSRAWAVLLGALEGAASPLTNFFPDYSLFPRANMRPT